MDWQAQDYAVVGLCAFGIVASSIWIAQPTENVEFYVDQLDLAIRSLWSFGGTEMMFKIDTLGAGEWRHYTFNESRFADVPLRMVLLSETGDADLYLSHSPSLLGNVSWELGGWDDKSASCGVDGLDVETREGEDGAVRVGVYGHPSHNSSLFHLLIVAGSWRGHSREYASAEYPQSVADMVERERNSERWREGKGKKKPLRRWDPDDKVDVLLGVIEMILSFAITCL